MAIDGADFIEVFKFFVKKNNSKNQAFESARRVFRGGLLTGGAPFTKDIVYLDGLIRVYNFLLSIYKKLYNYYHLCQLSYQILVQHYLLLYLL